MQFAVLVDFRKTMPKQDLTKLSVMSEFRKKLEFHI